MSIQCASTDIFPARPDKRVCGNHPARFRRARLCPNRRSRTIVRRGPLHSSAAPDDLIVGMMPIVRRVALQLRGHLPAYVELDDLVSAGTLGLIDAVRKFDSTKGATLESYARFRIRGAILDSLRDEDPASRDMRRRIKKIERACHNLEFQLSRPPSDWEMAGAMGVSLTEWYAMGSELRQLGFEGVGGKIEVRQRTAEDNVAASSGEGPFELCYQREQRDIFHLALACLTERERTIMALYYQESLTMRQIGARLGIDESRVSQLHSGALTRLRARVAVLVEPPAARTAVGFRRASTMDARA